MQGKAAGSVRVEDVEVIAWGDNRWAKAALVSIDRTPDECPQCHFSVKPIRGTAYLIHDAGLVQIVYQCPRHECHLLFVAFYAPGTSRRDALHYVSSQPVSPATPKLPDQVAALSDRFVKIYSQAVHAEGLGLDEVCGPGYRKALEVLVKDFAARRLGPDAPERTAIEQTWLGTCIKEHIDEQRVKQRAERAVWLGNDETHYVRRWEDKDLKDLKRLLKMTIDAVDGVLLDEDMMQDMPEGS